MTALARKPLVSRSAPRGTVHPLATLGWITRQFTAVLFASVIILLTLASAAAVLEFVRQDLPRIVGTGLDLLAHPRGW
jgi:hypothetical protein